MRTFIVALVMGLVVLGASPAAAGGNWIDMDDPYTSVGSNITIRATFSTRDEARTRALGPYYLYLEHVTGPQYGWGMPDAGDPDVYRIGTVDIMWPAEGYRFTDGLPNNPHIDATFTLPASLPLGRYFMTICDLGCKHRPGLRGGGPDVTGFLRVSATTREARLRAQVAELRYRITAMSERERNSDRREYKTFVVQLQQQAEDEDLLRSELAAAQGALGSTREIAAGVRTERNLALAAVALLSALLTYAVGRSRRRALVQPRSMRPVVGSGSPLLGAASTSPSTGPRSRPASPRATRRRARANPPLGSSPRTSAPPPARSRE